MRQLIAPLLCSLAAAFAARFDELGAQTEIADMYPGGRPPHEGDLISRPRLADTLAAIAADGREAFYSGAVGEGISQAVDGVITGADRDRTQADWVEPLSVDVFGATPGDRAEGLLGQRVDDVDASCVGAHRRHPRPVDEERAGGDGVGHDGEPIELSGRVRNK